MFWVCYCPAELLRFAQSWFWTFSTHFALSYRPSGNINLFTSLALNLINIHLKINKEGNRMDLYIWRASLKRLIGFFLSPVLMIIWQSTLLVKSWKRQMLGCIRKNIFSSYWELLVLCQEEFKPCIERFIQFLLSGLIPAGVDAERAHRNGRNWSPFPCEMQVTDGFCFFFSSKHTRVWEEMQLFSIDAIIKGWSLEKEHNLQWNDNNGTRARNLN